MQCDGSPDPTVLPEINMYMSLWREEMDNMSFDTVLQDSDLVLKVIVSSVLLSEYMYI